MFDVTARDEKTVVKNDVPIEIVVDFRHTFSIADLLFGYHLVVAQS